MDYVLVPQIVGSPDSWQYMFRWRPPSILPAISSVGDAEYLTRVFEQDGAAVYMLAEP